MTPDKGTLVTAGRSQGSETRPDPGAVARGISHFWPLPSAPPAPQEDRARKGGRGTQSRRFIATVPCHCLGLSHPRGQECAPATPLPPGCSLPSPPGVPKRSPDGSRNCSPRALGRHGVGAGLPHSAQPRFPGLYPRGLPVGLMCPRPHFNPATQPQSARSPGPGYRPQREEP